VRSAGAADTIGARALLVHAKNNQAKASYEHIDFETSPSDPLHLMLSTKDVIRLTGR